MTTFLHIGKFVVAPEKRDDFVKLMKDYEKTVEQKGLDHSHLIEDENKLGTYWHSTIWQSRGDWVAVEATPGHREMHKKRSALLEEPMKHDFFCGNVVM
ncbi:MAG: hypothetical protein CSA68_00305 [Rhodobacterales bacterium]|nr:MAG: hypothetical protein CSA68_00305 [Rhodobacterales bacterium]